MVGDGILLRRYAEHGDAQAFTELTIRYTGLVYCTCLRILGNPTDTEDVAQDCFLELARKAGEIRSSLPGWLHALARSRALDARRKETIRRAYEQQALPPREGDPITWAAIEPYVDEALSLLPDTLREPIIRHYLLGHSQTEIARDYRVTQGAISQRLDRGISALREQLRKFGILAPVALLTVLLQEHAAAAAPVTLTAGLEKLAVSGVGAHVKAGLLFSSWGKLTTGLVIGGVLLAGGVQLAKNRPYTGHSAPDSAVATIEKEVPSEQAAAILALLKQTDTAMMQGSLTADGKEIRQERMRNIAYQCYFQSNGKYRVIAIDEHANEMQYVFDGKDNFNIGTIKGRKPQVNLRPEPNYDEIGFIANLAPGPCAALGRGFTSLANNTIVYKNNQVHLLAKVSDGTTIDATLDAQHGYIATQVDRIIDGKVLSTWQLSNPKEFEGIYIATHSQFFIHGPKRSVMKKEFIIKEASFKAPDNKLAEFDWRHTPGCTIVDSRVDGGDHSSTYAPGEIPEDISSEQLLTRTQSSIQYHHQAVAHEKAMRRNIMLIMGAICSGIVSTLLVRNRRKRKLSKFNTNRMR